MKVLMIHGFCQNAEIFSSRTSNIRRKALKIPHQKSEFVFAESSLGVLATLSPDPSQDLRGWYNPHEAHQGNTRPVNSTQYEDWEQPLLEIRQLVQEQGPFSGLLAFSQGGVPAAVLLSELRDQFEFAIFVSCFAPADPDVRALLCDCPIAIPSMHVTGEQDEFVSGERSAELAEMFVDPVRLSHTGGHIMIPKELIPNVKEFLSCIYPN